MNIDKKNRSQLKGYFVKNSIPTEQQFADLIDGMLNQKDDGIAKASVADPLSILATIDTADLKKVIDFYERVQDLSPAWSLLLNPRIDSVSKPGFCLNDGTGVSRLFIDKNTGNVGIGTVNPDATVKLHVNGSGKFTSLAWKNSILSDDQGGSIELGGNNAVAGVGTPFIDFHYSGKTEDFNVRLINDSDKRLTLVGNLRVAGKGWIHDGSSNSAVTTGLMTNGSLTIGSTTTSFGGGTTQATTNTNAAGLLFETIANTEIAVHDYGTRIVSLMYYEGGDTASNLTNNRITIGRDMGWGAISSVRINGSLNVSSSSTPPTKNQFGVPDVVSGIRFTDNPGGATQDAAWIQYYARTGEACTLEIGVSNDADDHIALMPSGNVGIGTIIPNGKLDIANLIRFGLDEGGSGVKSISFARDAGDEINAGKITYKGGFGQNSLHIVGAGNNVRNIKLWDDVEINNSLKVKGNKIYTKIKIYKDIIIQNPAIDKQGSETVDYSAEFSEVYDCYVMLQGHSATTSMAPGQHWIDVNVIPQVVYVKVHSFNNQNAVIVGYCSESKKEYESDNTVMCTLVVIGIGR